MPNYIISDYRPPYCYGSGHEVSARRTYDKPWPVIAEMLSPDTCHYALITTTTRTAAIIEAKRRWLA